MRKDTATACVSLRIRIQGGGVSSRTLRTRAKIRTSNDAPLSAVPCGAEAAPAAARASGSPSQTAEIGPGLSALLRPNSRVGTRRINKCNNWHRKMIGKLHQPLRFSITFGTWHTKIMFNPAICVVAFLLPDHYDRTSLKPTDSTENC